MKRHRREMVCVGERLTTKGALAQGWMFLDGKPDSDERLWKKKIVAHASPGAVYDMTVEFEDATTRVVTDGEDGPTFVRRLTPEDDDRVLLWEARTLDAQQTHATERYEKRINEQSYLRDLLLPLRVEVQRLRSHGYRYALLNAISVELHRPLTQKEKEEHGL